MLFAWFAGAQTFPRQDIRFSADWKFNKGYVSGAQATTFNDGPWTMVCLPHTDTVQSAISNPSYDYYVGFCEYRKSFVPDPSWQGKKVFLEFEGAMQSDSVWLNGNLMLTYLGGYNPFTIDITGALKYGQTNVIAVCLNNNASASVSPGLLDVDFFYYGGLYRDVNIHVMDSLHITDAVYANKVAGGGIFVTDTLVSKTSATVRVKTDVLNEHAGAVSCVVKTSLVDSNGTVLLTSTSPLTTIASGKDSAIGQSFVVQPPRLWAPNHPNLYTLVSRVYNGGGTTPADSLTTTIGIRSVSFTGKPGTAGGFSLNDSGFIPRGANHHQDYGGIGNAVPASGQYRDALRLKAAGFNWVRCSHYLQNHAFLDACDKLGIMVEAALVGWQDIAGYGNATFTANLKRDLRTLIHYERNHPSVVIWESAMNESSPTTAWLDTAQAIVHTEIPGAGQAYTVGQQAGSCGTSPNILDVYQAAVQQCGRSPGGVTTPYGVSEYGHWEYGPGGNGFISTSMQTRANLDTGMLRQAYNHDSALSLDRGLVGVSFDALWVYNDYFGMGNNAPTGGYVNGICSGGIVDPYRYPKYSWYMFQSQRDPNVILPGVGSGPMVFIANQWRSGSPTSVTVFSNCDTVSLSLNGTLVATQKPNVGGHTVHLEHPPFTFAVGTYQPGTLVADGIIGGKVVAADTVRTPLTATKIVVTLDTAGMPLKADGSDIAIVYAAIVDSNGTVIPTATNAVTFSVSGPGKLITPDGISPAAIGGIAECYVQTEDSLPGTITVSASAPPLQSGSASAGTVIPPTGAATGVRSGTGGAAAAAAAFRMVQRGDRISFTTPDGLTRAPGGARFMLYNLEGRLVREWHFGGGAELSVSTGSCPQGLYYGKLTVGTRGYVQQVVKIGQ
jgi:hypothetical protein